ncbi:uncharacterized protein TNCV_2509891 [Trichonephila clavipes]|nr:uncharacterized protein TNCV_2509891 [Trichonephila clavipes]
MIWGPQASEVPKTLANNRKMLRASKKRPQLHESFWRMNHVILNHGQVTWKTSKLAPLLLTTTPHQREDVSALDRFSVHCCPTRRIFSSTGLEFATKSATIRSLYHSSTTATIPAWRPILIV